MFSAIRSDLHFSMRRLRRTPGFTFAVIALLAVAIGATLAAYGAVYRTLLQPLPIANADRIVQVQSSDGKGQIESAVSPALFNQLANSSAVELAAAIMPGDVNLVLDGGPPLRSRGLRVSDDFLSLFSLSPILGRGFDQQEHQGALVALLSESFWRAQLNGDANILGSRLALNGVDHEVVGVLPDSLDSLVPDIAVVVPMALSPNQSSNRTPYLGVFAKLPEGPTRSGELNRLAESYATGTEPFLIELVSLRELVSGDTANRNLLLLAGVLLALLVACFNVGNLVLARALTSMRDIDIRRVLGASNSRLLRSAVTESVVLVGSACVLGLAIASGFERILTLLEPSLATPAQPAFLDQLAATALPIAVLFPLLTLAVGALPALAVLKDAGGTFGRTGINRSSDRLRGVLTGAEVAITVVLVVAATTLLRSLVAASTIDPGFDATDAITAQFSLPSADYPDFDTARRGFLAVVEQAQQSPEIERAAALTSVPLSGSSAGANFSLVGGTETLVNAQLRITTSNAVDTLGLRLLAGRDFVASDREDSSDVVMINQSLALRLSRQLESSDTQNGTDRLTPLLGRELTSSNSAFEDAAGEARVFRIVGVVQDVKGDGLLSPTRPEITFPLSQAPAQPFSWTGNTMILAATPSQIAVSDSAAILALRRAAARVDPNLPLFDIAALGERLRSSLARQRFAAQVISGLGIATLALAAAGIYALGAFFAASRRGEVGLRLALGATHARLTRELLLSALSPAGVGLLAGLGGAIGLLTLLSNALPEIAGFQVGSTLGAVALLSGVALVAGWLPGRSLANAQPADVLRSE